MLFDDPTMEQRCQKEGMRPSLYCDLLLAQHPEAAEVRSFLELSFGNYAIGDEPARTELKSKFASLIDSHHLGAMFQLYLNRVLINAGFERRFNVAPTDTSGNNIDFLAYRDGQPCFYLEATTVNEEKSYESRSDRIENFQDTLYKKLQSDKYLLRIFVRNDSPKTPAKKKS